MGLPAISNKIKNVWGRVEIQMGDQQEITDTYSNDTEEWRKAQTKYAKLKEELERRIILSSGFGLGKRKLNNRGERKKC